LHLPLHHSSFIVHHLTLHCLGLVVAYPYLALFQVATVPLSPSLSQPVPATHGIITRLVAYLVAVAVAVAGSQSVCLSGLIRTRRSIRFILCIFTCIFIHLSFTPLALSPTPISTLFIYSPSFLPLPLFSTALFLPLFLPVHHLEDAKPTRSHPASWPSQYAAARVKTTSSSAYVADT
jgi:hypothetical protein